MLGFIPPSLPVQILQVTIAPLGVIFFALLYDDLVTEKNLVQQKPAGH